MAEPHVEVIRSKESFARIVWVYLLGGFITQGALMIIAGYGFRLYNVYVGPDAGLVIGEIVYCALVVPSVLLMVMISLGVKRRLRVRAHGYQKALVAGVIFAIVLSVPEIIDMLLGDRSISSGGNPQSSGAGVRVSMILLIPMSIGVPIWLVFSNRGFAEGLCKMCGYSLKGITSEKCPECGEKITASELAS